MVRFVGPGRHASGAGQQISQAVREILVLPDVRASLDKVGLIIESGTPQDFAALVRNERTQWSKVLNDAGLVPK